MTRATLPLCLSSVATRSGSAVAASALLALVLAAAPLSADGDHQHAHDFTHPITTSSTEAQELFDLGVLTAWGFNHKEAARLFDRAVEKDPACAMCFWGKALVLGPNINAQLAEADYPAILEALGNARELAPQVTDRERAYIDALAKRYGPEYQADRAALDKAFADAMRRVAYSDPNDLTAATLFAEALMDTSPWDYWLPNGEPKASTEEFIAVLETVLRRDPSHPGAAHLLIHAVEKARPELGVPAAEILDRNPQATGHLVHMASHIYMRVGRYDDAARVNQRAIEDDDAYAAEHEVPGDYLPYMLHNHHMRWAALGFLGRAADSRAQAEKIRSSLPPNPVLVQMAPLQHFWAVPLWDAVWFEDWQRVLAEPAPDPELAYATAVWHWASGVALARTGKPAEAKEQLEAMRALLSGAALDGIEWGYNSVRSMLEIGRETLIAEIAAAEGDLAAAMRALSEAARREDALVYTEPPPWLGPSRQRLGELQLAAGDPEAAEITLRSNLDVYPHNGRSLASLVKSLEAQGRTDEATEVRFRLAAAWKDADPEL
jgi:tetratricopeptide (TPR) repeat protein